MGKFYLLKLDTNWADEFDVEGVSVFTEEELKEFHKVLDKTEYPVEMGFGTNEGLCFESREEILNDISITEISPSVYLTINAFVGDVGTLTPSEIFSRLSERIEEEEEIKRESFKLSKIPDYSELMWEGALEDKEGNLTYEVISEEIWDYDIEKSYVTKEIIFVRYSDNKYFRVYYNFSYHWKDENATAEEVFPREELRTITIYE